MNESSTYRRFDPLSALAVLGCVVMVLVQAFFILELYNRSAAVPAPVPAEAPAAAPASEPVPPADPS